MTNNGECMNNEMDEHIIITNDDLHNESISDNETRNSDNLYQTLKENMNHMSMQTNHAYKEWVYGSGGGGKRV